MKGRILALSSAAVLTVYAAGYARTRSAAEMLEAEERRPPMPRPGAQDRSPIPATPQEATLTRAPGVSAPAPAAPPVQATAPSNAPATAATGGDTARSGNATPETRAARLVADAAASTTTDRNAAAATVPAGHAAATRPATATMPATATLPATTPAATNMPATSQVASAAPTGVPAPDGGALKTAQSSTAPQAPQGSQPLQAAKAPDAAAPVQAPSAATAASSEGQGAVAALAKWKDGRYTGWGTCRHGDLQATVQIENGRIVSASISQCLTRYPCDWIKPLPPEVVQRQSPETDYVSGATESTNAFYYAVLQALGKAAQ